VDGTIIERDHLHDTVEVYDASGRRHLGDFDPWDGRQVGSADPTRHVTYDRATEQMKGNLPVPPSVLQKVKKIVGFQPQDDGLGEYLLDEKQTRDVARILGFQPEPNKFYYYVEPYEPPEDDGFQQIQDTTR
jgi:hypothetical protein